MPKSHTGLITLIAAGAVLVSALLVGAVLFFGRYQLGIAHDLSGGTEFVLQAKGEVTGQQMDLSVAAMRKRLDDLGIYGVVNQTDGNHVSVKIEKIKDPDEAMNGVFKTGRLEFRKLDPALSAQVTNGAVTADKLPPDRLLLYQIYRDLNNGEIKRDGDGRPVQLPMVVDRQVLMTGDIVADATMGYDNMTGAPKVEMTFTDAGAKVFADVTGRLADAGAITGQVSQLAIVVDGEVVSAPTVKEKIVSDKAEITGNLSREEVDGIVVALRTGALKADFVVVSKQEIAG